VLLFRAGVVKSIPFAKKLKKKKTFKEHFLKTEKFEAGFSIISLGIG